MRTVLNSVKQWYITRLLRRARACGGEVDRVAKALADLNYNDDTAVYFDHLVEELDYLRKKKAALICRVNKMISDGKSPMVPVYQD